MTEFRFENACPEGCYVLCRPLGCSLETPFLDEFEQVAHAIEKRQREFLQTRNLARELMSLLGVPAQPILAEPDRAPRWPTGLVGSLTHNDTHGAVSLARSGTLHSVGLDIETQGRIEDRLWDHLFTQNEQLALRALPAEQIQHEATAIFSIKEAFYKYQFPLTKSWVGFQDVEVEKIASAQYQISAVNPNAELAEGSTAYTETFDDCVLSLVLQKS